MGIVKRVFRLIGMAVVIVVLSSCASSGDYYKNLATQSINDKKYQFDSFHRANNAAMIDLMFITACSENDKEMIELIVTNRPNIKKEHYQSSSASKISGCLVSSLNHDDASMEMTEYLVAQGGDVNAVTNHKQGTPVGALLSSANESTNYNADVKREILEYLVSKGASLQYTFPDGRTYADFTDQRELTTYLISQGVDYGKRKQALTSEAQTLKAIIQRAREWEGR